MEFERRKRLTALEEKLNYAFGDLALLDTAMTHTSYVKGDGRAQAHNERLEFLGDAVLELCVSERLYKRFADFDEGDMTRLRAQTVCEGALYEVAKGLDIGDTLLLGRGEDHSGGRDKPSILSDALEALIGALYIDGGMESARRFIMGFIDSSVDAALTGGALKDYKTMLQEYVQKRHMGPIAYRLAGAMGPDHSKVFTMEVAIAGIPAGTGEGHTKQEAGQRAARAALAEFGLID
ncbi:MAG TPA: ribonuclease III [Clostridia bacterium]|nr:ribonuclease III [Clostridia bacterium]